MFGILIDPYDQLITRVNIDTTDVSTSLHSICKAIGDRCSLIEVGHYLPNQDFVYVNEEGLLNHDITHGVVLDGHKYVGRVLLLGSVGRMNLSDAATSISELKQRVSYFEVTPEFHDKVVEGISVTPWE